MAKKTRKQKQRAAARRSSVRAPSAPLTLPQRVDALLGPDDVADEAEPAAEPVPATSVAAQPASRRRIERLSQTAPTARAGRPGRGPINAAAQFQPLDTEDAAIPFDRVPYVPADLRRVAITAAMMVVLILIAAVVVTHVVQ
jgi:hypothetical protein